jgi:hypothetical protein
MCLSAYGEYNDDVIEVAAKRHQKLVTWDFEYVLWLLSRELVILKEDI